MATTTIGWTSWLSGVTGRREPGYTWNPWRGCEKIAPECLNCYAEGLVETRLAHLHDPTRSGRPLWGPLAPRVAASEGILGMPFRWNSTGKKSVDRGGERPRVFVNSPADTFDPKADPVLRARVAHTIHACDWLEWILVTKRLDHVTDQLAESADILHRARHLPGIGEKSQRATARWIGRWLAGDAPPNVWGVVSVGTQRTADEKVPLLLRLPFARRGLSVEPLLEDVRIPSLAPTGGADHGERADPESEIGNRKSEINCIYLGGESGHLHTALCQTNGCQMREARTTKVEHLRSVRDQALAAGVTLFVKQFGSRVVTTAFEAGHGAVETRLRLHHPKGENPEEWPEDFRIQQFPTQLPMPPVPSTFSVGRSAVNVPAAT